jgi:hypothetical protein
MMARARTYQWLAALVIGGIFIWIFFDIDSERKSTPIPLIKTASQDALPIPPKLTASELLLSGYADPATPALDDLRKIQRVALGYFSVIKNAHRFPIGGNEDFAAALRGENSNREVFVRPENPIFSSVGLLLDRWNSPLIVHPEGWQRLEFRSAGPDQIPYNSDDLILSPTGISSTREKVHGK